MGEFWEKHRALTMAMLTLIIVIVNVVLNRPRFTDFILGILTGLILVIAIDELSKYPKEKD